MYFEQADFFALQIGRQIEQTTTRARAKYGGLRSATHDETVSGFVRDDEGFGTGRIIKR
jgi:hypothetical protein